MDSVNGDIELSLLKLDDGGRINIETVGGNARLNLPQNISATFDIHAHAGGRIKNALTNDKVNKAKYGPSSSLEFTSGKGDGDIEIDTINGKISLKSNN